MLLLSILGCLVPSASADPPPAWEYAVLVTVQGAGSVSLAVETDGSKAIPLAQDGVVGTSASAQSAVPWGSATYPTLAAALDSAGAQGWEIVAFQGRGQYLAKRRR